jgi:hypothetical protein
MFTGPIIRISPTELHIDEPEYYEELYSQHKPRNKSTFYVDQFNFPYTSFTTVDYKLHRARRAALNPFFSKQKVARLQPMLSFMVEKLCNRIEEFRQTGEPLSIRPVYACLTTDVVTLFTVNRSWNHLDTPDFSPLWVETIQTISATGHLTKQFPFIFSTLPFLPRRLIAAMNPGLVMLLDFQNVYACLYALVLFDYKIELTEHNRKSKKIPEPSLMACTNQTKNTMSLGSTKLSFMLCLSPIFLKKIRNTYGFGKRHKFRLVREETLQRMP